MDPATSKRKRRFGCASGLLLAISIVVALILVEVGARLLISPVGVKNPLFEPNRDYLFRLKPGASARIETPAGSRDKRVTIEISSQGFRDRVYGAKAADEFRIGILGDSFAMGFPSPTDQTLCTVLEKTFRDNRYTHVTVMNFGTLGTGPWQQRGILRDRGFALAPDLIIHQLFLGNDFADTLGEFGRTTQAQNYVWEALVRPFRRMQYPQYRADRWLEGHSRAYVALRDAIGLPRYQRILDHLPFFPVPGDPELPPSAPRPSYLECDLATWYPDLSFALDHMIGALHGTEDDCHAHGAGYVLFAVPVYADVSAKKWDEDMKAVHDGSKYERGKGLRELYSRLGQEHLPAFSVTETLAGAPNPDALYFAADGHLSAAGNAVVANRIYEYLTREYFPAHPDPRLKSSR